MACDHFLQQQVRITRPIEEVFAFFSDAGNLARLTPPDVGFVILPPLPEALGDGVLINYRIRLGGIPLRWQSRILQWNPPYRFADEQTRGPYAHWLHVHQFEPDGEATWVRDAVHYRLPFWPLGELGHGLIRRKLDSIFAYRTKALEAHFGADTTDPVDSQAR
jgi:ligand-binding SRPBCC domain-containing protein